MKSVRSGAALGLHSQGAGALILIQADWLSMMSLLHRAVRLACPQRITVEDSSRCIAGAAAEPTLYFSLPEQMSGGDTEYGEAIVAHWERDST